MGDISGRSSEFLSEQYEQSKKLCDGGEPDSGRKMRANISSLPLHILLKANLRRLRYKSTFFSRHMDRSYPALDNESSG